MAISGALKSVAWLLFLHCSIFRGFEWLRCPILVGIVNSFIQIWGWLLLVLSLGTSPVYFVGVA